MIDIDEALTVTSSSSPLYTRGPLSSRQPVYQEQSIPLHSQTEDTTTDSERKTTEPLKPIKPKPIPCLVVIVIVKKIKRDLTRYQR